MKTITKKEKVVMLRMLVGYVSDAPIWRDCFLCYTEPIYRLPEKDRVQMLHNLGIVPTRLRDDGSPRHAWFENNTERLSALNAALQKLEKQP